MLPSITTKTDKEPWGLVVNEAFNQGCPVVATKAVGAAAGGLLRDMENGLVVSERNSIVLAEAIRKIISNKQYRQFLSHNAKKEIKKWTYQRQAEGFLEAVKYSMKQK